MSGAKWFLLVLFLIMGFPQRAAAAENFDSENLDYSDIQAVIDDLSETTGTFQFGDYVKGFVTGEKELSFSQIGNDLINTLNNELSNNKNTLIRLISIAVIAAVFTNFSNMFKSSQVAETGFYVTYLLLFAILTASFFTASALASKVLSQLLTFMKVLVPTYFLTIAFSTGSRTSILFYESTLVLITIVDVVLIRIILPAIHVYFILALANNFSREDLLSKFSELLETIIRWTLKTLMGAVIGFNVIQGLIVPAVDSVKKTVWMKALGSMPGVGNAFGAVTETVLGAGVLIKNAVGVAGIVVIVIICAVPLLKLAIYALIYKFGAAVVQPISDKRILACMNGSVKSAGLLLYMVGIGAVLFLLTLTIITSATNIRMG